MTALRIGLTGSMEMTVNRCHLASYAGNAGADALSTHHVVLLMEQAARNAIQGRLPIGKITVGTLVRIRHMAATPLGSRVWAHAHLQDIQERRLSFHVVARDEWGTISEGQNIQLIVSVDRFLEKVNRKHGQMGRDASG